MLKCHRDGVRHLVLAAGGREGRLLWLENTGLGAFVEHEVGIGLSLGSVAVADVTSDGFPDIVASQSFNDLEAYIQRKLQSTVVRAGVGRKAYSSPRPLPHVCCTGNNAFTNGALGYFKHNGMSPPSFSSFVRVFGNPSNSGGLGLVRVADMNLDSRPDIVAGCGWGGFVLVSSGGTPQAPSFVFSSWVAGPPNDFVVADIHKDGSPDVVTMSWSSSQVYLSVMDHGVAVRNVLLRTLWVPTYSLGVADLDGNGHLDICAGFTDYNSMVQCFLNRGPTAVSPPEFDDYFLFHSGGYAPPASSLAIADLNGDGTQDIVIVYSGRDYITWWANVGGLPPSWTGPTTVADASSGHTVPGTVLTADVWGCTPLGYPVLFAFLFHLTCKQPLQHVR
jgi:hypothetical protein